MIMFAGADGPVDPKSIITLYYKINIFERRYVNFSNPAGTKGFFV